MWTIGITVAFAALASASCGDTVEYGYTCEPQISHNWGEYSPYFSVPSTISDDIPLGCAVTFVNVLSRHGSRFPTTSDTAELVDTIQQIHNQTTHYSAEYEFIKDYQYTLGADDLTVFGQIEMSQSGQKFFERYRPLTNLATPFFRSSSDDRVVESAQNFSQGYHQAKTQWGEPDPKYPYQLEILSENPGTNNTLFAQQLCTVYNNKPDSKINNYAEATWLAEWITPVQTRVNDNLIGANLSAQQIVYLMELCPYNTVATPQGKISPFCGLFTVTEWEYFTYYRTVDKWYEDMQGNPLGPTTQIGYVSELLARLTDNRTYVTDAVSYTSVNHTLDNSQATFPLGIQTPLYVDVTHDDNIFSIFAALGLYNATQNLSNTTYTSPTAAKGFASNWVVPFAGRAYFEKMACVGEFEELVRVVVNDRVVPLQNCGADSLGRCTLSRFVESQTFTTDGGQWEQCFT